MKAVLVLLLALLLGCARQDHARIGDLLEVLAPWSRETLRTASVAAGYLSIRNRGQRDDRLLAVETAVAQRVEIHQTWMAAWMRMRLLADGLPIPAGRTVTLAPGGSHLMFIAPVRHAMAGEQLDAVLVFRDAGRLPVSFAVRGASTQGGVAHAHH
jgi:copper(I)-binding protein